MIKIYISGPISGLPLTYAKQQFYDAAKEIETQGFTPVNPMELDHTKHRQTWADFMRVDIKALADCQGIYMLKGWQNSHGAVLELKIAESLGMFVAYQ